MKAKKLYQWTLYERGLMIPFFKQEGLKKKIKFLVKKAMLMWYGGSPTKDLIELEKRIPYEGSEYVGQFGCPDSHETEMKREWFDKSVLLDFEDDKFSAPIGYKELLENQFGDYMQLPPVEQRVPHASFVKFYWLNN